MSAAGVMRSVSTVAKLRPHTIAAERSTHQRVLGAPSE